MTLLFPPPSARTASASSPPLRTRPRASGTPRPEPRSLCSKAMMGSVVSAAFSPDGKRVVTASWDKTARVWDPETGTQIARSKAMMGSVVSAAFSPDGKRVVTASDDKTARVWDPETGTQIAPLKGHDGSVVSAAFSPDGKRVVTASADKTARIWDVRRNSARQYPSGRLRLFARARRAGPGQPRRRDPISADFRPTDLRHRPAAAGPFGRGCYNSAGQQMTDDALSGSAARQFLSPLSIVSSSTGRLLSGAGRRVA